MKQATERDRTADGEGRQPGQRQGESPLGYPLSPEELATVTGGITATNSSPPGTVDLTLHPGLCTGPGPRGGRVVFH